MLIPTCTIKFFELLLTIACLVLHQFSFDLTDLPTLMLCSGTYVGYIVVLSGEIVGEVLFTPLDLVQDMFFGILGLCLFSIDGGMILSNRLRDSLIPRNGDHNTALLSGGLSLLTAMFMLYDLALAYMDSEEYNDEASEIVSAAADAYIDMWWTAWGSALFGACGGLTMYSWREVPSCPRKTLAIAAAGCAVANAVLMFLDTLVAMCYASPDEDSVNERPIKQR